MSIYKIGKMRMWLAKWGLVTLMLLILSSVSLYSQEDRKNRRQRRELNVQEAVSDLHLHSDSLHIHTDSLKMVNDSIRFVKDSIARADSIFRQDSLAMLRKSSL